jgi:hypothetical protein
MRLQSGHRNKLAIGALVNSVERSTAVEDVVSRRV